MSVSAENTAYSSREIDFLKTAQEALHTELLTLTNEGRDATEGERARIEALAARIGAEQHPDIQTPGAYAAIWSQIASGFEIALDESDRQTTALEVACFELAYPEFAA